MRPGEIAQVTFWRYDPHLDQGRTLTVAVELGQLATLRLAGVPPQILKSLEAVGIGEANTSTRRLAEQFGATFHPGVVIEEIVPGSQLDGQIEPGSIIVAVMDRPVTNLDEFLAELFYELRWSREIRMTALLPDGTRLVAVVNF